MQPYQYYAILVTASVFNVLTNIGFKFSELNKDTPARAYLYFAIALLFGLVNSVLFTYALRYITLGVSSIIFFSITIIGLVAAGILYFGEKLSITTYIGTALILIGMVIIFWNQLNVYDTSVHK